MLCIVVQFVMKLIHHIYLTVNVLPVPHCPVMIRLCPATAQSTACCCKLFILEE